MKDRKRLPIASGRPGRATLRPRLALVGLLLILGAGPARAEILYGVTETGPGGGQLLRIDTATGAGTLDALTLIDGLEDLEVRPDGQLLTIGLGPGTGINHGSLYRFDPVTDQGALIGVIRSPAFEYRFVEGMAFIGNTLYASAAGPQAPDVDNADQFISIDPTTGAATLIGAFGEDFKNVEAMAFFPGIGLIGADIGIIDFPNNPDVFLKQPALIRIDPATGQGTLIRNLPTDRLLAGLAFAPDGTLYGSTIPSHFGGPSRLVRVNPSTGDLTDIGPIGFSLVDGLRFSPTIVPEPGSLVLLGLGGAVALGLGWRRMRGM